MVSVMTRDDERWGYPELVFIRALVLDIKM